MLQHKDLEQSIMVEIDRLIRDAEYRFEQISVTRQARLSSELALQHETKRYDEGAIENYQVLQAQRDLTNRRYAEINANVTVKDKSFDLPVRVSITVKERIEASPPSVYFSRRDTDKLGKQPAPPSKQLTIKRLAPSHSFQLTKVALLNATLSKSG